jgi:hypothetical protein
MLCAALVLNSGGLLADDQWIGEDWSVTLFAGPLTTDTTTDDILVGSPSFEDSMIVGAALNKGLVTVFEHLDIEAEAQAVKHFGDQDHWEFNGLLLARWTKFPWDHVVDTTVAIGDGLSFPTEVPPLETRRHGPDLSGRVLNYVLGEVTFALPEVPEWNLVWRFHHRSGFFGAFDGVTEGSTVIGGGIKYKF